MSEESYLEGGSNHHKHDRGNQLLRQKVEVVAKIVDPGAQSALRTPESS